MIDKNLKQIVEQQLQLAGPLTKEQLDKFKERPNYNTDNLIVGKSKCLFYLEYPPMKELMESTSIDLKIEVVWDHQLEAFLKKYNAFGEPNGKVIRVTPKD